MYRLTNETIAGDAGGMNGSVTYTYDAVGNRKQKVSTLPGYPGGLTNYNANDQLATDTYDANGNTTASGQTGYVYDFENHLISANGITYVYDGDGHRVSKTVNGTTTTYATTDINPTGYSQVVGESYSPRVNGTESQHSYIYGLDAALELRSHYDGVGNNLTQQMYFVHDGHGSVRVITDQNDAVTDSYDYDAFGVPIHQTGTTPNTTLYSGEQYDPDPNLYYNRARYLNTSTGRFWTMDEYEGDDEVLTLLHKYLYATYDPVNELDPSRRLPLSNTVYGDIVHEVIEGDFLEYLETTGQNGIVETDIGGILGRNVPLGLGGLSPDMVNLTTKEIYDIKAVASAPAGAAKIALYLYALNGFDKRKTKWQGGTTFRPRNIIRLSPITIAIVSLPFLGLITYEVADTYEIYFLVKIALEDAVVGLSTETSTAAVLAVEGGL